MRKILAAVDNSAAARPVLAVCRATASALGCAAEAVHVVEDGDQTAIASAEAGGVPLELLSGDPIEQLLLAGADPDVAVLVLGARDTVGGPRPAGHLAMAVAERTDTAVVLVPPEAEPPGTFTRILVAMEGSRGKAHALERMVALATEASLEIVVMHVDEEVPRFTDQVQHETLAYGREYLSRHLHGAGEIRLELRLGLPANEVLGAIGPLRSEIVAVGWPHGDDPGRGSVAREIVGHSPVPILLVPAT